MPARECPKEQAKLIKISKYPKKCIYFDIQALFLNNLCSATVFC